MENIIEFLAMEGQGVYIWSSYAIAAGGIIGLTFWITAVHRAKTRLLKTLEPIAERRRKERRGSIEPSPSDERVGASERSE